MRCRSTRTASPDASCSRSSKFVTALLNSGVRWVLYADLMLLFGLPFFRIHGASARQAAASPPRRIWLVCTALGVVGLVASIAGLVVTAAMMAGVEVTAVDRATLSMIVTETTVGMSVVVRCAALIATIFAALWLGKNGRRSALALVVSGAAIALASLAWSGHAAAGEGWGGALHLTSDIVHLCAAAVWVGALASLMAMVLRDLASLNSHATDDTYDALRRFAHTGSIVVMLIVASGAINTAMLVGASNLAQLPASLYGCCCWENWPFSLRCWHSRRRTASISHPPWAMPERHPTGR